MTPRDPQAEQDRAEWLGWAEAQGYPPDTGDRPEYAIGDMRDAFLAGVQYARDLDAATLAAEVRAGHVRIETGPPAALRALRGLLGVQPQPAAERQHDFSCHADDRIHAEDCECWCHDGRPAHGDTELRRRIEDVARGLDHRVRAGSRTRMAVASSSIARILRDILAETAAGPEPQPAPGHLLVMRGTIALRDAEIELLNARTAELAEALTEAARHVEPVDQNSELAIGGWLELAKRYRPRRPASTGADG